MLKLSPVPSSGTRGDYSYTMSRYGGLDMNESEAIMPLSESPEIKNADFSDGSLRRIMGFGIPKWKYNNVDVQLAQLPSEVHRLFEFQATAAEEAGYKNFYYSGKNGGLYYFFYNSANQKISADMKLTDGGPIIERITYLTQYKSGENNCALVGGPTCGPYRMIENGTFALIDSAVTPYMKRTAMHYGRMFGIGTPAYPQRIWFSELNNPTNFNISDAEGGYIDITDLIGNTVEIVSFFDTLYVFCRYGIVALNTLSSPDDFAHENVYYSDSEIIDGSITIAGNKMVFATRCGVYSFNGSVVTHISRKINGFFADSRVICREEASIYFKGKYYLSYHLTDGSKGMLIYDFADNAWNIYAGPEIQSMALLRDKSTEKMITAFTDSTVAMEWGIGNYFATSGIIEAKWRSPKTFFGEPACKKTVKEIHLSGSGTGKIKITVYGDTASQAREITLTSSLQTFRLPFDISGNQIYFEIENILGAYFKISPLTFVYSLERQFAK